MLIELIDPLLHERFRIVFKIPWQFSSSLPFSQSNTPSHCLFLPMHRVYKHSKSLHCNFEHFFFPFAKVFEEYFRHLNVLHLNLGHCLYKHSNSLHSNFLHFFFPFAKVCEEYFRHLNFLHFHLGQKLFEDT